MSAPAKPVLGISNPCIRPPARRRIPHPLRKMIAAVKFQVDPAALDRQLATALLAESYYQQSQSHLAEALAFARQATSRSPGFGFAWVQVAQLEFSFGRTARALAALENSLR